MKKLLLIALLIVGCDNSTESSPKEWICIADPVPNFESESSDAVMKPHPDPHTFNSIEECEEACPDDSIKVTSVSNPEGTGEYITFICSEYSSNP